MSVDIKELTVSITEKMKVTGEFEYVVVESMYTEHYSGAKEFARFPFRFGATGFSFDLVFSLYYDIKGNISVVYTLEATQGVQYKDGNFRFIFDMKHDVSLPVIEASGQIGNNLSIQIR